MLTGRPRGTVDILPDETDKWYILENTARQLCAEYGYREIRTPVFEHTELFTRSVGDTTDIVEKEMYTFTDRGERSITLRPEGTAPVVRAFLEHGLEARGLPVKLFYMGPMFRYGRPQAGRLRQFHQFGAEVFGSKDPGVDAEIIALAVNYMERLGLSGLELHINSVGCPICRKSHEAELKAYLGRVLNNLCKTCQERYQRNPLRIFDCKSSICREIITGAPVITGSLCHNCRQHFNGVRHYLEILDIHYMVDEHLVRGLDYYTNTAFEVLVKGIGAQNAVGGGGRYDNLVEVMGGRSVPGIGFGIGLERVLLALENQGREFNLSQGVDVLVVTSNREMDAAAVRILSRLRGAGLRADKDYLGRSMKAQMKYANRYPAKIALIIGEEELARGKVLIRRLNDGSQEEVAVENIVQFCTQEKERGW